MREVGGFLDRLPQKGRILREPCGFLDRLPHPAPGTRHPAPGWILEAQCLAGGAGGIVKFVKINLEN